MHRTSQKGFLELIVIVLIALILLRFLGIDLKAVLAKEWVIEFLGYMKTMLINVWHDLVSIWNAVKGS